MTKTTRRAAPLALAFALAMAGLFAPAGTAAAADSLGYGHDAGRAVEQGGTRRVSLGKDKSLIVELPVDAKDVLVSSPRVADAVMRSTRKAFLIGMEVGHTNVFFFDGAGRTILALDVTVARDVGALENTLARLLPDSRIAVEGVGDSVVLKGDVIDAATAAKAVQLAARFVEEETQVVNLLQTSGGEQVLLKVTIAEMQRNTAKQLGINLTSTFTVGNLDFAGFATENAFPIAGGALGGLVGGGVWTDKGGADSVDATLRALEQNNMLRTLAEPTLTAISGESADFLAGGEIPFITGIDRDTNTPTVDFKEFGVSLNFTPVVLSGGRISLTVGTEVSEISAGNSISIGDGIAVPGLNVRRANTTVELPSGGSIAIAGLIQDDILQAVNGVPGLMHVPILGSLFRSRDFERSQTELVVLVTPFLARHTARNELSRPDDGFETTNDAEAVLLGRLNKRYGRAPAAVPAGGYRGSYGFIVD